MNIHTLNGTLGRIALALTTTLALTLTSGSAAVYSRAAEGSGRAGELPGEIAASGRLDGVAAALLTRPAASLTSAERRDLADRYTDRIIAANTDLEAFARGAEFAAVLAAGDSDEFVMTLSYLTLDATNNWTAIAAGPLTRLRQRLHNLLPWIPGSKALLRYGSQGFAFDDKSNQPQHFWYSVAITYRWGRGAAEAVARYREWNPPALLSWVPGTGSGRGSEGDLALSRQGMALGQMLRAGSIQPEEVGKWLRAELATR